jgi:Ca2+-binding EF-hand superfamily protein
LSNLQTRFLKMKHRFVSAAVVLAFGAPGVSAAAQAQSPQTIHQQKVEQRLDKRFDRLDANHDGVLNKDELHRAAETRRARVRARLQQRIDARFAKADKNQDGAVSRDEWPGQAARFDRLDANHDGTLSKDEIGSALGRRMGRRRRR